MPTVQVEIRPATAATSAPNLRGAAWRWFDDMATVPWDLWTALPGASAYLDPRYFRAMAGHSKVQCRLGLLMTASGDCVGGIQMQSVLSLSLIHI